MTHASGRSDQQNKQTIQDQLILDELFGSDDNEKQGPLSYESSLEINEK